jgi:predicted esterase YcpF (UPF0227 family)
LTQAIFQGAAFTASHLVYLHGFRSSPNSFKAKFIAQWLKAHRPDVVWFCPQLPASPHAAADMLLNTVHSWPKHSTAIMGSSLGGFYATWLGALMQCRTVLLNPAVHPARDLVSYIGTQTAWHNPHELVKFEPHYIDELKTLYVGQAQKNLEEQTDIPDATALDDPSHLLNMVAKGDEVLSWQEMVARYPTATLHLIEGSDHGLSDFEQHFPVVQNYLGLLSSEQQT